MGEKMNNQLTYNRTRFWLLILFIVVNLGLPVTGYIIDENDEFASSFYLTYLFGIPTILSIVLLVRLVFKVAIRLRKPTYIVIFYTILAPFTLLNIIPVLGLITDITKNKKRRNNTLFDDQ